MKILFAADTSFNYFSEYKGRKSAELCMKETAEVFDSVDFSVINLENVFGNADKLTPIVKSGPNLISDEGFFDYIDVLKPTVVGLANNHCGDFGKEAIDLTMKIIAEKGYTAIGAGENIKEAYRPAVLELGDIKVAIFAVCENEFGIADEHTAGSAGYSLSRVSAAISKARMVDMLPIIYFHGGNEQNPFPSPGKAELYRHFVDLGAAAVIAMHTHCPQGYEIYNGCPIVYSMGNFFFPAETTSTAAWSCGYMTVLDIDKSGIKIEIIPYKFDFEKHSLLKDEEKRDFMRYMDYICAPIGDPSALKKYFDSWCMICGLDRLDGYINSVRFDEKMLDGAAEDVVALKNIFSCEAHNELINNSLKILYDGRTESAKEKIEEIKVLQNMRIPL